MDAVELGLLSLAGFAIGLVGGMVGLVLGVVRLPIILGVESSVALAAGTNIGVSAAGAVAAAVRHMRENRVHLRIFLVMALTGAAGGFLGSFLTGMVPDVWFLVVVLCIVGYEAFAMVRRGRGRPADPRMCRGHGTESAIGFGVGFLGGLVGLVLGSIRLPAMIQVLGMESRVAIGTNMAASGAMGIAGLAGHAINGGINPELLAAMGSAAILGNLIGSKLTGRFAPDTLKRMIGFTLLGVMAFLALRIALEIV